MEITALLPLVLIVGVFWLLVMRPAKAKQAKQLQLQQSLRPGQRVMTTAGLFGTVTELTDDQVQLEIAPGVEVRYVKAAIMQVVPDEDDEAPVLDVTDAIESAEASQADPATSLASPATPADGDGPARGGAGS